MTTNIEKVVQEFVIRVDGLDFSVKARISEIITGTETGKFYWSISHHYSPVEDGHTYYPSARTASTLEEAKNLLMAYAESFTLFHIDRNQLY